MGFVPLSNRFFGDAILRAVLRRTQTVPTLLENHEFAFECPSAACGQVLGFQEQDGGAARFRSAHMRALPSTGRGEPNFARAEALMTRSEGNQLINGRKVRNLADGSICDPNHCSLRHGKKSSVSILHCRLLLG
jgi:hypothetical protein